MKRIFSYLLPVFAAGTFAACSPISTIENRVDSLESRVVALETAVGKINERVDALKALVEGGTISSVEEKDGAYTITLSDGKVIKLNQGSVGVANPPVVSIDADGYWMVDYGKGAEYILVGGQKVKAVGADGVTPMFGVDAGGYWTVSYDGGKTYEQVKDADGAPVKAVPDGGSSEDKWFEKVSVADGNLEVVMKGGKSYKLPIVSDFSCVIKGADDVVTFTYGETKTFDVEMTGVASVMVSAPQNWSAKLENAVLSVTAPAAVTKALSADSDADVCLLVISEKGFSSISKLRVKVSDETPVVTYPGLYGKYSNGEDVVIGGVTVNKTTYPTVNYISSTSEDKTLKSGVNFVDADVVAEFSAAGLTLPFIVAGNTEGSRTVLNATTQVNLVSSETISDNVVRFQNIKLSTESISANYLIANTADNAINSIGFKDCGIELVGDKNLMYMAAARPVNALVMEDCDVKMNSTKATNNFILQVSGAVYTMAELTFTNNVFWSDSDNGVKAFSLYLDRKAAVSKLTVTHNTFVNLYPQASYAYCQINDMIAGDLSNNLFYFKDYATATANANGVATYTGIVKEETAGNVVEDDYAAFNNNYSIYGGDAIPTQKLKLGQNAKTTNIVFKLQADATEVFDFTDDSENFNIEKGIFKPKKAEYGAQR